MIFQTDSALCESPSRPLSSFYRYVFTGAPWRRHSLWLCRQGRIPRGYFRCVGNSGVSLWRRDVMERLFADAEFMNGVRSVPALARPARRPISHEAHARCSAAQWSDRDHLDVWVSNHLQNFPNSTKAGRYDLDDAVPTEADAARFSIETYYSGGYTPFAVHQPQWYLKGATLSELLTRCPAAVNLKNYSLVQPLAKPKPAQGERPRAR